MEEDATADDMKPREIAAAIRRGEPVSDAIFDRLYPEELRARSEMMWTPVAVAARAAQLLALPAGARVLDVGSGVGKACLVGMLASATTWWGIEQDPILVAAARRVAHGLGVDARFLAGDAASVDWDQFDAFYFYNPFGVLMLAETASPFTRYATIQNHLRDTTVRLAAARLGTRVATYHGFGAEMPAGYQLVVREAVATDEVAVWIRDDAPVA